MIVAINGGRSVGIEMGGKAGDKRGRRERAGKWRPGSRDEVPVTFDLNRFELNRYC